MTSTSRRVLTRTASSFAALALLVPVLLAGCGNDDDSSATTTTAKASSAPKVTDVWARPGTAGGNSAMYMTITGGSKEDQLTKVTISSDVVATVELHETTTTGSSSTMAGESSTTAMAGETTTTAMADGPTTTAMAGETTTSMAGGMMGMQPVKEITIPAGETVTLKPGGYHVMLIDLKKDLKAGDTIPATLTFSSGDVDVTATVKDS